MNGSHESDVPEGQTISRRDLLKGLAALGAGAALSGCASQTQPHRLKTQKPADLIRAENKHEGTRTWLLEHTRIDPATKYRSPWIEGYCSRTSVKAGEQISFHVSTNPASRFTLDIYRMGYYGGKSVRQMLLLGLFSGIVST